LKKFHGLFHIFSGLVLIGVTSATAGPRLDSPSSIPGVDKIEDALSDFEETTNTLREKVADFIAPATGTPDDRRGKQQPPTDNQANSETIDSGSEIERSLVYVIPIEDKVQSIMMTVFKRGLIEAKGMKADLVLLEMDTPGGELHVAEEISRTLLESEIPTATWIKNEGLSAGMLIAISTQKIFMKEIALIGDCQPIFMGAGEMTEAPEKILTVVREYGERAAVKNGYPIDAVLAMIDVDEDYKFIVSSTTEIRAATGKILTLRADEAVSVGMVARTAQNMNEVLEHLDMKGARLHRIKKNWAENLAWLIAGSAITGILTLIGLAALFIEYKTPGFGLFGGIGLVILAFVFWGHSIAHLAGWEGAIFFLIGMALIGVEIFLIPGFGIFGAVGGGLIIFGLVLTFLQVPFDSPFFMPEIHLTRPLTLTLISSIGAIILIFVVLKVMPRLHTMAAVGISLPTELRSGEGYSSFDSRKDNELIGAVGKALGPLHPGGIALFGSNRIDVVTEGEFIAKGDDVRVTKVEGARVVVRPDKGQA